VTDSAIAPPPPEPRSLPERLRRPSPRLAALGSAVIAGAIYLATMNRTLGFLDSGEVAAAAATLGIMHPTGYPTMTMLGYLATLLVPVREILALNILAALLAGAGVGALTLLFDHLLATLSAEPAARRDATVGRTSSKNARSMPANAGRATKSTTAGPAAKAAKAASARRALKSATESRAPDTATPAPGAASNGRAPDDRSVVARTLVAALTALAVAFTAIWWEQATGFEVYALQALLLPLVTFLFLRFVDRERERRASGAPVRMTWDASLFALVLGLAFTNHLMTIFLAPAFLVHYFWSLGIGRRAWTRLVLLVLPFVAGLLPYLYLPIRSSMRPRFNWGRPDTLERLVDHVSGKFAWEWMFSSEEIYRAQTGYFFDRLPSEVAWVGLALAAIGIIHLFARSPRLAVWSALVFLGCVGYAGGYRIYDIELYYPTAILAIGIWIVAALGWLLKRHATIAVVVAGALALANLVLHYAGSDRSGNRLAEDFVANVLTSAPRNTMIFSSNAAVFVTGSYYLQEVERLRPDVTVINHDYLSNDWYVEELRDWKPELMRAVGPMVATYRDLTARGNAGDVRAGLASTDAYDRMLRAFVDWQLARGGSAMVVGSLDRGFGSGYRIVPFELGYLLASDSGYVAQPFPTYRFRHWRHIDPFAASIYEIYGRHLAYRASYEAEHGHMELAKRYRQYALTFDPQYELEGARELPLDAMSQVRATDEFYTRLAASKPR